MAEAPAPLPSPSPAARALRRIWPVARVLVGVGLLVLLCRRVEWSVLVRTARELDVAALAAAVVAGATALLLTGLRWRLLVQALGMTVSIRTACAAMWEGYFFSQFLPTQVGGDVYRVHRIWRETGHLTLVATSVLVDRILGTMSLLLFCALGAALSPNLAQTKAAAFSLASLCVLLVAGAVLLFSLPAIRLPAAAHDGGARGLRGKLWRVVVRLQEAARAYRAARGALLAAGGLALLVQVANVAWAYFSFAATGHHASWADAAALMNLGMLVGMVPISIAGLGLQEGTWVGLSQTIGLTKEAALGAALLLRLVRLLLAGAGGLSYLLHRAPPAAAPPEERAEPPLTG